MNLVLAGHFPPVYLKADKKGRHRYSQAVRRADRGNIEPLAALIAMSVIEIYEKMLNALQARRDVCACSNCSIPRPRQLLLKIHDLFDLNRRELSVVIER